MKFLKTMLVSFVCIGGYIQQSYANTNNEAKLLQVAEALKRGEYSKAFKILKPLADNGDPLASYGLAGMYETGAGIPQNDVKAREYYTKAANGGLPEAQLVVGKMFALNDGNYSAAAKWYQKAADQDDADAQYHLGALYLIGLGVAQDNKQAFKWYKEAAIQNHPQAQHQVGAAYIAGIGVQEDSKKGIYWMNKACANQVKKACETLDLIRNGSK